MVHGRYRSVLNFLRDPPQKVRILRKKIAEEEMILSKPEICMMKFNKALKPFI
jgi:hypothetical protein